MFSTLDPYWPHILSGLRVTLELSLGGGALAFVLAVILGLAAISRNVLLRGVTRVFVEFFRGTSLVVQLFFLVYAVPLMLGIVSPPAVLPLLLAIIALGLNYGAYGSEVVRGSLNAVPQEQWESTTALSMPWLTKIRRIIWPQAWALMLPGLNNLMVMLVKGTAIAFMVSQYDLTYWADQMRKQGVNTWLAYGVAFVLYYLAALAFSAFLRLLERRAQRRLGLAPTRAQTTTATAGAVA